MRHVLYAYIDGSNLNGIANTVVDRLDAFVSATPWAYLSPVVVNQRHEPDETVGSADSPDWDLGLNADLPDPGAEPPGWVSDVEKIALFLGRLSVDVGQSFVLGIANATTGLAEDLFSIDSAQPDLETLRAIIGVDPLS